MFVACESGIIIWNVSETDEAQQLMHIQTKSVSVLEFHPSKQNSQNGGVLVCGGEKVVGFHISSDFKKYVPMDDSQWPDVSGIGRLDVLKVQADRDSFTVFASFKTQNQSTIAIFSIDNKFPTEIIKHTELIFDIQPITGTNGCDILSESQTRRVMPKQPDFATPYEPKVQEH